jgi:hypothetical protein
MPWLSPATTKVTSTEEEEDESLEGKNSAFFSTLLFTYWILRHANTFLSYFTLTGIWYMGKLRPRNNQGHTFKKWQRWDLNWCTTTHAVWIPSNHGETAIVSKAVCQRFRFHFKLGSCRASEELWSCLAVRNHVVSTSGLSPSLTSLLTLSENSKRNWTIWTGVWEEGVVL